jgi:hypothetical protein
MNTEDAVGHLRSIRRDRERYLSHSKQQVVRARLVERLSAIDKAIEALQIASLLTTATDAEA